MTPAAASCPRFAVGPMSDLRGWGWRTEPTRSLGPHAIQTARLALAQRATLRVEQARLGGTFGLQAGAVPSAKGTSSAASIGCAAPRRRTTITHAMATEVTSPEMMSDRKGRASKTVAIA
jgi:hypothetical protein